MNNAVAIISLVIVAAFFSWHIALAGFVILSLLTVLFYVLGSRMQDLLVEAEEADESANMGEGVAGSTNAFSAVEIIENVRTIQLLGKEEHFLQLYREALTKTRRPLIRAALYDSLIFGVTQSFMWV